MTLLLFFILQKGRLSLQPLSLKISFPPGEPLTLSSSSTQDFFSHISQDTHEGQKKVGAISRKWELL